MIEAEATKLKKLREGKGLLIKYAVAGTPYTIYREA